MTTDTYYLKNIAEEIAANPVAPATDKPNHHLLNEVKRLERTIISELAAPIGFTPGENALSAALSELADISDILYRSAQTVTPDAKIIIQLIASIKKAVPNRYQVNFKLPKAFIVLHKDYLTSAWAHHSAAMQENFISEELIQIAAVPFQRFTEASQTLNWRDYTWLKAYQAKLDNLNWQHLDCNSPEEALLSLLIGRDFNDDRFYARCKQYIRACAQKASGKREKLLQYAECRKLVLQDMQYGIPSFDPYTNPIGSRLVKWIEAEMDFVQTHEREKPLSKFEFKWNVETIAFFFKLLWDHKVFGKVSLEPLSEQIAANCSSVGRDEFQATTIFSRFYVKDLEVLRTVEQVLSAMLEDVRRFL